MCLEISQPMSHCNPEKGLKRKQHITPKCVQVNCLWKNHPDLSERDKSINVVEYLEIMGRRVKITYDGGSVQKNALTYRIKAIGKKTTAVSHEMKSRERVAGVGYDECTSCMEHRTTGWSSLVKAKAKGICINVHVKVEHRRLVRQLISVDVGKLSYRPLGRNESWTLLERRFPGGFLSCVASYETSFNFVGQWKSVFDGRKGRRK